MPAKKELFYNTIVARRTQQISLRESFIQALEIAKINPLNSQEEENTLKIAKETLSWVEAYGAQKALQGQEPAYHNRQHFADACIALAFFLSDLDQFTKTEKLILLITIMVHDFGHCGLDRAAENPMHEAKTIHLLRRSPLQRLDFVDFKLICKLIYGTSPGELAKVNQQYLDDPTNKTYLMQSLINDADIATSFIEPLTPILSKKILNELGNSDPSQIEIQKSIEQFMSNFYITTSTAKIYLGIVN